jgi:hypothetical protein
MRSECANDNLIRHAPSSCMSSPGTECATPRIVSSNRFWVAPRLSLIRQLFSFRCATTTTSSAPVCSGRKTKFKDKVGNRANNLRFSGRVVPVFSHTGGRTRNKMRPPSSECVVKQASLFSNRHSGERYDDPSETLVPDDHQGDMSSLTTRPPEKLIPRILPAAALIVGCSSIRL